MSRYRIPFALGLTAALLAPFARGAETSEDFKKSYKNDEIKDGAIQAGDILIRRKYDGETGKFWTKFNDKSMDMASKRANKYGYDKRVSPTASHAMLALGNGKIAHANDPGVVTESIPDYYMLVFRPTNADVGAAAVGLGTKLADKGLPYSMRKAAKLNSKYKGPIWTKNSYQNTIARVTRYSNQIDKLKNGEKVTSGLNVGRLLKANFNLVAGKGFFCSEFVVAVYQAAGAAEKLKGKYDQDDGYVMLRSRHTLPIDLENFLRTSNRFKFVGARFASGNKVKESLVEYLEQNNDETEKILEAALKNGGENSVNIIEEEKKNSQTVVTNEENELEKE